MLLGRNRAATVYAVAALATPAAVGVAVAVRVLPPAALIAVAPSLLLFAPLRWAFGAPEEAVPIPALAANVGWNLATNAILAIALIISR